MLMGADLKIRAAVIGVAIGVMIAVTVGVFGYMFLESHNQEKQAECIGGVSDLFPEAGASETASLIRECQENPDGASTAWLTRYLKQVAEAPK